MTTVTECICGAKFDWFVDSAPEVSTLPLSTLHVYFRHQVYDCTSKFARIVYFMYRLKVLLEALSSS